jgi:hypothetical protein
LQHHFPRKEDFSHPVSVSNLIDMAPKRGGSSSGGSASSCPDAFETSIQQVYLAQDVVFFLVFLGIAIALCSFRKKSVAGKKLLGIPYILTIFFFLM